jgi:hypothetical protein
MTEKRENPQCDEAFGFGSYRIRRKNRKMKSCKSGRTHLFSARLIDLMALASTMLGNIHGLSRHFHF